MLEFTNPADHVLLQSSRDWKVASKDKLYERLHYLGIKVHNCGLSIFGLSLCFQFKLLGLVSCPIIEKADI